VICFFPAFRKPLWSRALVLVALFSLGGCAPNTWFAEATFLMEPERRTERQGAIRDLWRRQAWPEYPPGEDRISWQFLPGDPSEGSGDAPPDGSLFREDVQLPHRVNLPDHPLWYRQHLSVVDSMVLHLRADDGAQVWWRGQRLRRIAPGEDFLLTGSSGEGELVIRVLNNAGKGGLKQALLVPLEQWRAWKTDWLRYQAWDDLACRYDQWIAPPAGLGEALAAGLTAPLLIDPASLLGWFSKRLRITAGPSLHLGTDGQWSIWMDSPPEIQPELRYSQARGEEKGIIQGTRKEGLWWFVLPARSGVGSGLEWQIRQGDLITPVFDLLTKDPSAPASLVIWGDSQSGWDTFRVLQRLPVFEDADLVLGLGDLVGDGSDPLQWESLWDILRPRMARIPHWLIPGNHDYDGWYDDFRPEPLQRYLIHEPSYSHFLRRWGTSAFLALDPNGSFPIGIRDEQWTWLRKALHSPAWQEADWRFLLIHQPPFAQGWPGYAGDLFIRDLLDSLYAFAPVDVVLSGHNHDFERGVFPVQGSPTLCIISGGGGGGLEPEEDNEHPVMDRIIKRHHLIHLRMSPRRLDFSVLDTRGQLLDTFFLEKPH